MAVNDTWIRTGGRANIGGLNTDVDLGSVPLNDTLLRIHGGLRVIAQVPGTHDPSAMLANTWAAGIYTTLTTGGATLNALTQNSDAAPPLQRWLWWERLIPVPRPLSGKQHPDSRQVWYLEPMSSPIDIKAQVKATTAIDVHLAISAVALPTAFRDIHAWFWASILRSGL